ncbi:hypothetical protein B9G98_04171 [Wickerhamiella sorbophila]|uniref:FHA domain-containing protein n=1 Tax=Wickerhamiella sorbophila TaxID=45607 RepID=A0A2T0FNH9_9ASCO|nr:hypothetical protein B9G98_04171 [Wickerhamiella sorbophila]PRT56551.1 hypothetical protein B9G98_04171 [Wickerhamiella sorbophila]
MWIANIDGLRRKWLKPGKTYTVGRSSKSESDIVIKEPSVSRSHITISIAKTQPMSAGQVSIKSRVTVTDLGSRFGSQLNSVVLEPNSPAMVPTGSEIATLLVGTRSKVVLEWAPQTITFSASTSETEDFNKCVSLVEPMDIKVVSDIVPSTKFFLKAAKTSTKLLYALAKGLPVVSLQFSQAIADAADEMEVDFAKFPQPLDFLADPKFAPDETRKSCLANYTFYILDKGQYDALEPIIKQAGGKCVFKSDPWQKGMLVIEPPREELKAKAENLGNMVDPSAFLVSIRDKTPIKVMGSRARKPKRAVDMLTFMTQSQPTQASQPLKRIVPVANTLFEHSPPSQKRKRVEPLANVLFGQFDAKSARVVNDLNDSKELETQLPPAPAYVSDPEPVVPSKSIPKRQIVHLPLPSKRLARPIDVDTEDYEEEPLSIPSTPELANLVLVENCIAVDEVPQVTDITPSQTWNDGPNFKAFKRNAPVKMGSVSLVKAGSSGLDNSILENDSLLADSDRESTNHNLDEDEFSFHFS